MNYVIARAGFMRRQYRWYLKSANHKKIAVSGENYHNKADAYHAIDLVRGSADVGIVEL